MKLSFSLSSKPSTKHQQNLKHSQTFKEDQQQDLSASTHREYVTEFDSTKTLIQSQPKKLVIPPKPNEWRPHKKMKNLDLPSIQSDDADRLQFVVDPTSYVEPSDSSTSSYGLHLRQSTKTDGGDHPEEKPLPRPKTTESVMLQKLKDDLMRLPEDNGFEEFTDVPVDGFGAALLAGYGWYEGRGIGRNAKEDVKVVEYKKRTSKEGLGFVELPTKNGNSGTKVGRNTKEESEQGNCYVGKYMRIVGGREMGLKGRIVEVMDGKYSVVLKLSRSEEEVMVNVCDVAELGSVEEERCLRKLKELKIKRKKDAMGGIDGKRDKDKDSSSERDLRDIGYDRRKGTIWSREDGKRGDRKEEPMVTDKVSWLTSHIRVRLISKTLKGGRLYLKKGEVVDVVGPTICDISMDESKELIQGVDQELLETALPLRGGPVLVLCGRHKGVYGSLVERDTKNETGIVRDADTHELLNVHLEHIAEYIGDPSYIGY